MSSTKFVRAQHTSNTLVVYQAYNDAIANAALDAQAFVAPFSFGRMTWIKPSFLWMMERSGWAQKRDQERVLAITLKTSGFFDLLSRATLTHPPRGVSRAEWRELMDLSPVRVQWDPERDLMGQKLDARAIQVGIGRERSKLYASNYIARIDDVTGLAKKIDRLRREDRQAAKKLLPKETRMMLPDAIRAQIAAD